MLTDISTEMVASILPVYLMVALRLSLAEYGVADGIFRGGAAVAALLLGAFLTYDLRRAKVVAGCGYALSALTKVILLFSGAFVAVGASLVLDRLGKGLRVAPRDAILASPVPPSQLGKAFGVHRAMDGLGAVSGPLLAAAILWYWPSGYGTIFGIALVASLIGLMIFALFVRPHAGPVDLLHAPRPRNWRIGVASALPPPCRRLLAFAMLLTLFTVTADGKMQMKEALKIAEQWAIVLIGGKKGPGVSNQSNAFDFNLQKNGGLRQALQKVDWCK